MFVTAHEHFPWKLRNWPCYSYIVLLCIHLYCTGALFVCICTTGQSAYNCVYAFVAILWVFLKMCFSTSDLSLKNGYISFSQARIKGLGKRRNEGHTKQRTALSSMWASVFFCTCVKRRDNRIELLYILFYTCRETWSLRV